MLELTPAQEQVLYGIADGQTTRQIAAEQGVSYDVIKEHLRQLRRLLGARNCAQVVALAYHEGLLKAPGDAP